MTEVMEGSQPFMDKQRAYTSQQQFDKPEHPFDEMAEKLTDYYEPDSSVKANISKENSQNMNDYQVISSSKHSGRSTMKQPKKKTGILKQIKMKLFKKRQKKSMKISSRKNSDELQIPRTLSAEENGELTSPFSFVEKVTDSQIEIQEKEMY